MVHRFLYKFNGYDLFQVLSEERERCDKFLTDDDIAEVLSETDGSENDVRKGIVGYPSHPLYKQIAAMLQIWLESS